MPGTNKCNFEKNIQTWTIPTLIIKSFQNQRRDLWLMIKFMVYQAAIISTLLYGCHTLTLYRQRNWHRHQSDFQSKRRQLWPRNKVHQKKLAYDNFDVCFGVFFFRTNSSAQNFSFFSVYYVLTKNDACSLGEKKRSI